jgi:hypothetical protein
MAFSIILQTAGCQNSKKYEQAEGRLFFPATQRL